MARASGSKSSAPSRRRQSLWVRWLLALIVLAAAGLATLNYLLDPARLGAWLLSRAEAETGLRLHAEQPAKLHLWPGIQLSIDGLEVSHAGAAQSFAKVDELRVRVPLEALWQAWEVEEIRARGVRFDWEQYSAATSGLAPESEIGPPRPWVVPTFRYIELRDLQLLAGGQSLKVEQATLSPLAIGVRNQLTFQGSWNAGEEISLPFQLLGEADLSTDGGELALTNLGLDLRYEAQLLLRASGSLRLDLAAQPSADIQAELGEWPSGWPSAVDLMARLSGATEPPGLTEPEWNELLDQLRPTGLRLRYPLADDIPPQLQLELTGPARSLQASIEPQAVIDWWQDEQARLRPPPIELQVMIPSLQLKGHSLEGITIESHPAQNDDAMSPRTDEEMRDR